MSFNVNEFLSQGLTLGGARPTQFNVSIFVPFSSQSTRRIQFLAKAASLPPMPLDAVPMPYFGRKIQLAGDREFPPWTITVLNDEDFAIRLLMENWSNRINTLISNLVSPDVFPLSYKVQGEVRQFSKSGPAIRGYQFFGMFPINIDQIPLDWDATNQVEQFDVTFAYDYWVPDSGLLTGADDYSPSLSNPVTGTS